MRPDDPRHGTYAGVQVHHKEAKAWREAVRLEAGASLWDEDPMRLVVTPGELDLCEPCRRVRRRYQKRLEGEHAMGRSRRVNPVAARMHISRLIAAGMTVYEIKDVSGVALRTVYNIQHGRTASVNVRTMRMLLGVPLPDPEVRHIPRAGYVPRLGAVRRLQALVAIGHTLTELAERTGMMRSNLCGIAHGGYRDRANLSLQATTWWKIAALYDELHMLPGSGPFAKTARTVARRNGWAPPLAWDDIDDPDEVPKGMGRGDRGQLRVRPGERLADLNRLADAGESLLGVCRELDLTVSGLWKWCDRHGHLDLYETLAARSRVSERAV